MSKKTKGGPSEIDVHVGQRLRVRRALLGLSQEKLASALGLTFQQIQKYERGTNRISAGRLYDLSKILDVPVSYFFEQVGLSQNAQRAVAGLSDNDQDSFDSEDLMSRKETIDLVRTYYSVPDPAMRKDILKFIKSMAEKIS
ncbi:MAG: helix-turn-helix transcriptional regulator [Rhodospirillales bacterium]|nr:helix-turn-helix transcriptional regulator [Rhodospirillales bacterium]